MLQLICLGQIYQELAEEMFGEPKWEEEEIRHR